jgi:competence protein ComEC
MRSARRHFSYFAAGLLALAALGIWSAVFAATPKGLLTFAVLDIGQGDALYIESPTGAQVLIDGGPDGSVLRELPKVMRFSDRTLDAVVATHQDADHIAGLVDVLKRYYVGAFIEPGLNKDTVTAQALEDDVDEEGIPRVRARRGMWVDLGGGARLDILSPDFDVSVLKPDEGNEGCAVSRLTYGSVSALLMCDAPMDTEDHLMAVSGPTDLQSTLLKVGHHGSAGSTGDAFLDAVAPVAALISVGAGNRYGHPADATIARLESNGIPVFRTDQEGAIILRSDGRVFSRIAK